MSDELLIKSEMIAKIQRKAEREQAGVAFIFDLLTDKGEEIQSAFQVTEEDEGTRQAVLYDKTKAALEFLESESTRSVGVSLSYLTPNDSKKKKHPLAVLGWAQYSPALPGIEECPVNDRFPHVLHATEEGVNLVNAYREQRGLVSIQEQRCINRERLHKV